MKSQKCAPQLPIPSLISPLLTTSSSNKSPRKQEPEFQFNLSRGQLIETIARLLLAMIAKNQNSDLISPPPGVNSSFYMKTPPQISLFEYIKRISDYSNCSDACFLLALIYIDRFLKQDETFELNSLNVFKLFAMATILAAKFIEEKPLKNDWYAKVLGIKLQDFNKLEVELLINALKFNLFVDEETLISINESVMNYYFKILKGSATQEFLLDLSSSLCKTFLTLKNEADLNPVVNDART